MRYSEWASLLNGLFGRRPSGVRRRERSTWFPNTGGTATVEELLGPAFRIHPYLDSPLASSLPGALNAGRLWRRHEPEDERLSEDADPAPEGRSRKGFRNVDWLTVRSVHVEGGAHDLHGDVVPLAQSERAVGRRTGHLVQLAPAAAHRPYSTRGPPGGGTCERSNQLGLPRRRSSGDRGRRRLSPLRPSQQCRRRVAPAPPSFLCGRGC